MSDEDQSSDYLPSEDDENSLESSDDSSSEGASSSLNGRHTIDVFVISRFKADFHSPLSGARDFLRLTFCNHMVHIKLHFTYTYAK